MLFLNRLEEWEQVQEELRDGGAGTFDERKEDEIRKERICVEVENLRIRKQPGLDSEIVDYIAPGVYTIVDKRVKDEYHWGKLLLGAGWIALEYTENVIKKWCS